MTDILIEKIKKLQNPVCVGLDTSLDYLPENMRKNLGSFSDAAKAVLEFNLSLIDKLSPAIPAVKVQIAYYEMLGAPGLEAFQKTCAGAKKAGLVVIADCKRNDIGSTAGCYSQAFLGETEIGGKKHRAFEADYLTVNGYLGADGIEPFLADCKTFKKGIFVLVKTSNPSSGQLQNRKFENGETLFEAMGSLVAEWGKDTVGRYGYSSVGAVVGATHPKEAELLRKKLPHTLFLIPGYGAQGGSAEGLSVCFDENGLGGIVNNSRGILCAYRSEKYKGLHFADAAHKAAVDMQEDIFNALKKVGKKI